MEQLIIQIARKNKTWGSRRIKGQRKYLGHNVCHTTIDNVLQRNDYSPGPDRARETRWSEFLRSHRESLAAIDFFTHEICTLYDQALQELRKVHDWPASINQAAARSLEEGMEETLTITRLRLPSQPRRLFASTNIIESCFSRTGDLCRGVKRRRDGNMAERGAGAVRLEAASRFRRIQGYGQVPLRLNPWNKILDLQEAAV